VVNSTSVSCIVVGILSPLTKKINQPIQKFLCFISEQKLRSIFALTFPEIKCKIGAMKDITKKQMADSIREFHLPRYDEIPDVGYYLEQTVTYINQCITPLGCAPITNSMISNYVKKDVFPGPQKKQYYAEQIAHLIVVSIVKNVLSLDNITKLFHMQKGVYTDQVAYDYFCSELENMLHYSFGLRNEVKEIGDTVSDIKTMLRGVIIAVSQLIYLNACFNALEAEQQD